MKKRKVFIVLERRADYSRYKPIMEKMKSDSFFEVYLVVTGICLLDIHGKDVDYIKNQITQLNDTIKVMNELLKAMDQEQRVRNLVKMAQGDTLPPT